eukprot:6719234-Alexandrium_andersonii.AAC.1
MRGVRKAIEKYVRQHLRIVYEPPPDPDGANLRFNRALLNLLETTAEADEPWSACSTPEKRMLANEHLLKVISGKFCNEGELIHYCP